MENNFSDKQMRDKLKSIEAPYDPKAWEQMEVKLDDQKKRRGFFWWWFGGAAASMLLVAGYYQFTVSGFPFTVNTNRSPVSSTQSTVNTGKPTVYSLPSTVNTNTEPLAVNKPGVNNAHSLNNQPAANRQQSAINVTRSTNYLPGGHAGKRQSTINAALNKQKERRLLSKLNAGNNKSGNEENHYLVDPKSVSEVNILETAVNRIQESANQPTEFPSTKNTGQETEARANSQQSEIFLDPVSAMLTTNIAGNKIEKKDEDVVLPKRKKIFNYSLGVIANVTGTIVSPKYTPEFSKQPSYAIGLTHEFMFWKRFAITNSIAFSQTSFSVQDPATVHYFQAPRSYTSNITELDIPIGIKVYPVSKEKIRFYVQAGIINHIKLKESFSYTVYRQDTLATNTASIAGNPMYPAQTNFSGGSTSDPVTYSTGSAAMKSSGGTSDFSINNSKRYYASFYSSIGIDYIVKKHFVFFAESLFYMSLEKIGVQDKRKYNLGLSGGFRCQF